MMKALSGVWILLLLSSGNVSGLNSVLVRDHKYINYPASWENARHTCKRYYSDLATIYSEADVEDLYFQQYYAWIGMQRDQAKWSDILVSDHNFELLHLWEDRNPPYIPECVAVSHHNFFYQRVYGLNCGSHHFFICQDNQNGQTDYIFIPEAKNWSEAQHYCSQNHEELANIPTVSLSTTVQKQDFPIWIGLHKDGGSWNWNAGSSEYHRWALNEPSAIGDCVSISSETNNMSAQNCNASFPFLCISDNVILVKEEKSWEEALKHCRGLKSSNHTNLRFDLLSLQPGEESLYMMAKVMDADTEEVWTGLCFLAGEWLWVNGADMLHTDLPFCPTQQQNCGALSKKDAGKMKTRDCLQKKNFLCYSYASTH
uniref:Uncharacterized LOC107083864 n=1 Tax=Cyprinodon variegatus TaxID=28743 RepID=A0A3Q2DTS5_CYPVA